MQLHKNEIMTGLLVVSTVAVLVFVLVLLGAPGFSGLWSLTKFTSTTRLELNKAQR